MQEAAALGKHKQKTAPAAEHPTNAVLAPHPAVPGVPWRGAPPMQCTETPLTMREATMSRFRASLHGLCTGTTPRQRVLVKAPSRAPHPRPREEAKGRQERLSWTERAKQVSRCQKPEQALRMLGLRREGLVSWGLCIQEAPAAAAAVPSLLARRRTGWQDAVGEGPAHVPPLPGRDSVVRKDS